MTERDQIAFEKKLAQVVEKSLLALQKSTDEFQAKLNKEYHLDTLDITLKFTEEILGTGAEQDIDLTFKKN